MEKWDILTDYEKEIMEHIVAGVSFSELAMEFGLSIMSLKSELALIISKLEIKNVEYELLKLVLQKDASKLCLSK